MAIANPEKGATMKETMSKLNGILSEQPQELPTEPQEAAEPVESPEAEVETQPEVSDTEPKPRRLKTKLGDREVEYEILSEISDEDAENLRLGSMMEQDYRIKTSDLSKERKKLESDAEKLNSKLSDLEDILSYESNWLESNEAKELREDDPDAYLDKIDSIKRKAEKYQKYKAEQQEKVQERHKSQVEAEISKYSQVIPEWLDESKRNDDLVMIEKTLQSSGFDNDFIGSLWGTDHRFMSLLRKAALFDSIQNKSIEDKRVKVVPKSSKPASRQDVAPEKTARQKRMERLKKTGSIKDAQAAIKDILGG